MKKSANTQKRTNTLLNVVIISMVISFILFIIAKQTLPADRPVGGELAIFLLPAISYFLSKNIFLQKDVTEEYKRAEARHEKV